MGSYGVVEEDLFFDSHGEVFYELNSDSDCAEGLVSNVPGNYSLGYEFWTKKPDSVNERRDKFLKWMSLSSDGQLMDGDQGEDTWTEHTNSDVDKLQGDREIVLANFDCNAQLLLNYSFQSSQSCDATDLQVGDDDRLIWRIKNLDNGAEFAVDEHTDDEVTRFREVGSDKMMSFDEFQKAIGSSGLVQHILRKDYKEYNVVGTKKKVFSNWLRKFSEMTHVADKLKRAFDMPSDMNSKATSSTRRVHVDVCGKRSKELTSLHTGQEFPAHEGSIRTMKFSTDGQYLASAGEDGIVRVWKVLEDDIVDNFDIQDADPSSLYFSLNHFSKLCPSDMAKEKMNQQLKGSKKQSDAACVIIPQKVFHLMEKPLHEFQGHKGEVLALSWSGNGHLLSSSVDKTARLWKLGNDHCLGIFSHNNYVTCIEFNPLDDNYFISGSIDGKLRIWEIHSCRVIDWTDIREIITAVCYSPDGKGGVVGSVDGKCSFYAIIDNRLELGAQMCLKGKVSGKSVTAFQFCPSDSSKVMVTSADSRIRILSGTNVVDNFKGSRGSVSQAPASFTSDGNYILSATEDSNVHVWSCKTHDHKSSRQKSQRSRESFLSRNASIAIPWCGLKNKLEAVGIFLDSLYKGPSTCPEEKLPISRLVTGKPSICRSEFKFLKNAWLNAFNSPHLWGLVIVTAGWDGCIRTFLNYGLPIRF